MSIQYTDTVFSENMPIDKAVEKMNESLFTQCCSNPIYNSWNKQVDCTKMNEVTQLARSIKEEIANGLLG